jgi:hypothetical protein
MVCAEKPAICTNHSIVPDAHARRTAIVRLADAAAFTPKSLRSFKALIIVKE